jgi:hypothetical protein
MKGWSDVIVDYCFRRGMNGVGNRVSIVCIALWRHLVFDRQELGKIQML